MRSILIVLALLFVLCGCTHRFEVGNGDGTPADRGVALHPAEASSVRFYVFGAIVAVVGIACCIWTPFKTLGGFLATCGGGVIVINEFVIWVQPFLPWIFGGVLVTGLAWAVYHLYELWDGHVDIVNQGVNTTNLASNTTSLVEKAKAWLKSRVK